ncbi:hypothetical protein EON63_10670 [archaeon]|nr:MAG: hypothetical protein EON63_10670 [archaeon]
MYTNPYSYTRSHSHILLYLPQALSTCFLKIDEEMRAHQQADGRDSSGCTSVTCMVTPTHLVCANAGDSRCVMGTGECVLWCMVCDISWCIV